MKCIEEATIRHITPLISIVKLAYGNIESKSNTTCIWNESKISTILPNLSSKYQYLFLLYSVKNKNTVSLESTKFEQKGVQRCLELLSCTVDDVWKPTSSFQLNISHENLIKRPISDDIKKFR